MRVLAIDAHVELCWTTTTRIVELGLHSFSRKGPWGQGSTLVLPPKGSGEPETVGDGRGNISSDVFSYQRCTVSVAFLHNGSHFGAPGDSSRGFLLNGAHYRSHF